MKFIMPIAVIALLALQMTGAVPQSSESGAMTLALFFLMAALAAGIYEAWSAKRGVLGGIVSTVVAIIGGILAASLSGMAMEKMLMLSNFEGSLAGKGGPLFYGLSAAMMVITLLGSWSALWVVNRLR